MYIRNIEKCMSQKEQLATIKSEPFAFKLDRPLAAQSNLYFLKTK